MARPKLNRFGDAELDKAEEQFGQFEEQVNALTKDRMDHAPKEQVEQQTKLSSREISDSKEIYLKPKRSIGSREKFNERFRDEFNFSKEYVQFIAENKEIIGETITMWTKAFPGQPAEEWDVPVNKPVWAPRYVAEQIKKCNYHRLRMEQNSITSADGMGNYYGTLVVDTTVQRLDALPVTPRRSLFFSKSGV